MNCDQLRLYVIRPTLEYLRLWSKFRENLLLGTCAQESAMGEYIVQIGGGPALGIYQMEPTTFADIYKNYLCYEDDLRILINHFEMILSVTIDPNYMIGNLIYATAMAFMSYYRHQDFKDLAYDDVAGMAAYWKKWYNTTKGKGTEKEFIDNYARYVTESSS